MDYRKLKEIKKSIYGFPSSAPLEIKPLFYKGFKMFKSNLVPF